MFLVKQGFVIDGITATKGKTINLTDKKLIKKLVDANLITEYSAKEASNKELQKQVQELVKTNNELTNRITELEEENQSLKDEISSFNLKSNEAPSENDGNSNSDDNGTPSTTENENPETNKENSENSENN